MIKNLGRILSYFEKPLDFQQECNYETSYSYPEQNGIKGALEKKHRKRKYLAKSFLQVRNGVCVVGFDRDLLLSVKAAIYDLLRDVDQGAEASIESLHVKQSGDIKDGAFMVPKLVFVVSHVVGRKLLDETGTESGQLDQLYDEAWLYGADVFIVYVDLPRLLYPPLRNIVYHPRVAELLFRDQPLLRDLAHENRLITITADANPPSPLLTTTTATAAHHTTPCLRSTRFSLHQQNALREWLARPVTGAHPIHRAADYLSSVEYTLTDNEFGLSDSELGVGAAHRLRSHSVSYYEYDETTNTKPTSDNVECVVGYQFAVEQHPLVEPRRKRLRKKTRRLPRVTRRQTRRDVPVTLSLEYDNATCTTSDEDMQHSTKETSFTVT